MWTNDRKPDGSHRTLPIEGTFSPRETREDAGCNDIPPRVSFDVDEAEKFGVGIEVGPELRIVAGQLLVADSAEQVLDPSYVSLPGNKIDIAMRSRDGAGEEVHTPAAEYPMVDASLVQKGMYFLEDCELLGRDGIHVSKYTNVSRHVAMGPWGDSAHQAGVLRLTLPQEPRTRSSIVRLFCRWTDVNQPP